MTVLAQLADAEILVKLDGQDLVIRPKRPLNDRQLDWLRRHKQELISEIMLHQFIDLVRACAACDAQILLHRDAIAAALDAATIAELMATSEVWERQHLAAAVAYKLTRARITWEDV